MGKAAIAALGGIALLLAVALVGPLLLVLVAASAVAGNDQGGPNSGVLAEGAVPAEYLPFVLEAGARCEGITAPVIAAQIQAESGWNPDARSPVGAEGISQFMPGTWATWGKDYDGNGTASAFNPADAIGSQADFMCHLYGWATIKLNEGRISGDPLDLALAAYNAGPGAVQNAGGIPPFAETQGYVARIRAAIATFTAMTSTGNGTGIVDIARTQLGVPYVWGGGNTNGPTRGGFDCSGFTVFAIYQATGITLPHLADAQARTTLGTPVTPSLAALAPGDVIAFSDSGGRNYQHVGIYIGSGQMIHAPIPGRSVEIADLAGSSYWMNQVWSVRRYA